MFVVFLPLLLIVVAAVAWAWWANTRPQRVPITSVESFHRALDAMRPDHTTAPVSRSTETRSRV